VYSKGKKRVGAQREGNESHDGGWRELGEKSVEAMREGVTNQKTRG